MYVQRPRRCGQQFGETSTEAAAAAATVLETGRLRCPSLEAPSPLFQKLAGGGVNLNRRRIKTESQQLFKNQK